MMRTIRKERGLLLFLLPSLLGLFVFYIAPFIVSLYYAAIDNSVSRQFVGLGNFLGVLRNGVYQLALRNTGIFMLLCVPLNIIIPLALALLLNRVKRFRAVFGIFFLMPLVIPSGAVVYFWHALFDVHGAINGLFFAENPVRWLETPLVRGIITGIFLWKNVGFNMVLFRAGLGFIPKEYYETAQVEGAGHFRVFRHVTLVYLIPTGFLAFILSIVNSFKAFREIYLLTGAYPNTSIYMLQHYMNNQFTAMDYQKLSSSAYITSVFIVLLLAVFFRLQRKLTRDL